jgi:hypothetical protein
MVTSEAVIGVQGALVIMIFQVERDTSLGYLAQSLLGSDPVYFLENLRQEPHRYVFCFPSSMEINIKRMIPAPRK